ncbi:MAG: acetate kinase [Bacteroidales bacterium]|nr:acetate kinase [Bacteroidales bacterium]
MNVLVINCGSSSVKFQLFRMPDEELLMQGKAEKIQSGGTGFFFRTKNLEFYVEWDPFSFPEIFRKIMKVLVDPGQGCLSSLDEIDVTGHRLIHGGEQSAECVGITPEWITYMESCIPLAPLHYPANLEGIRMISELMPGVLQAGVFDTAFHHTLPAKAYLYGISLEWYRKYQIRRYGFHGTSHKYASRMAIQMAGFSTDNSRIISCHLGNGASLAAVKNGKSVDTSMGFTPVEGLLMGTRSGDIDAGVLMFLQHQLLLTADEVQEAINVKGGLLGLSEFSSDYRAVEEAAGKGIQSARTALDVYHYRVKKYIGAYAAAMGGLDALVFTGGIGENSPGARKEICREMEFLGICLSEELNTSMNGRMALISDAASAVKVMIVPANEELMIAREVAAWAGTKAGMKDK